MDMFATSTKSTSSCNKLTGQYVHFFNEVKLTSKRARLAFYSMEYRLRWSDREREREKEIEGKSVERRLARKKERDDGTLGRE